MKTIPLGILLVVQLFTVYSVQAQQIDQWTIPAGGNGYLINKISDPDGQNKKWDSKDQKYMISFKSDKPGKVELSVKLAVPEGKSKLKVIVGEKHFTVNATGK